MTQGLTVVNILIVEDEMLVAADLEATIEDLGHTAIGIAPDLQTAMQLAERQPDLALVDLNLRDGETGPEAGEELARRGVIVVFVTGNPRLIENGISGTLGMFTKPLDHDGTASIIDYAWSVKQGDPAPAPPPGLKLFRTPEPH